MKEIRYLDVKSIFKVSMVIGGIVGLLIGFILMVSNFVQKNFMEGVVVMLLAPVLYGLMGALTNALIAWIYNKAVLKIGGIRFVLEDVEGAE